MGNRLLSIWPNINKDYIYNNLIKNLNLEYLVFSKNQTYTSEKSTIKINFDTIDPNESLKFYENHYQDFPPLSPEILNESKLYEKDALDIIYRWRNSLIGASNYLKISELYLKLLRFWNGYILEKKFNFICYLKNLF